jgi:hypothetical protein
MISTAILLSLSARLVSKINFKDFRSLASRDIAFIISSIGEQNQFQRLPKSGVTA